MSSPLCVILGPTASGKSALAHAVARAAGAQILAVDSMTVYGGMDIGTAKPSAQERAQVPYHGLDLAEPNETFTVARWLEEAERVIGCRRHGGMKARRHEGTVDVASNRDDDRLVLVGGTPLYLQALFHGMFEGPPADPAFREALAALSTAELHARLAQVDPSAAARIHLNDRKRLTRALEVHHATGRPISELQTQWESATPRYPSVRFGLAWPREELNRRINARVKQMMSEGWLEEVRGVLDRFGDFSPTAAEATGYGLLANVVRERIDLNDAVEQIKIRTRQLAKRQMTWFRRFADVTWLGGSAPIEENVRVVLERWTEART